MQLRMWVVLLAVAAVSCKVEVPADKEFAEFRDVAADVDVAVGADADVEVDAGIDDADATLVDSAAEVDAETEVDSAVDAAEVDVGTDAAEVDVGTDAAEVEVAQPCSPTDCDDSNDCTVETCDEAKGCVSVPGDASCTDGDACTVGDACKGGACLPGAATACDDGNPCTDDSCDKTLGCVYAANLLSCLDGDACTVGDACKGGACAGAVKSCDDGNGCTADSCDVGKGCLNAAVGQGAVCDLDGSKCTPDGCAVGLCKASAPVNCNDKNACTADSCDPGTGLCVNKGLAVGASCDDGDLCTLGDACGAGGCKGVAKVCAGTEVCKAGGCVVGAPSGMVLIPAGSFKMGCVAVDSCSTVEKPQHTVMVDGFYMDNTEVTAAAYKKCVDAGKCGVPQCSAAGGYATYGVSGKDQHPANCVTWSQAEAYCKWTDPKGRLPTEAEWEKAARGGLEGKKYPWGDQGPTCTPAQPNTAVWSEGGLNDCGKNSTWAVGTGSSANGYGLYDMSGNVWEWVSDWYGGSYYGSSPGSNPQGPSSGSVRVLRGGSFGSSSAALRSSSRGDGDPSAVGDGLGFRCSRSLP